MQAPTSPQFRAAQPRDRLQVTSVTQDAPGIDLFPPEPRRDPRGTPSLPVRRADRDRDRAPHLQGTAVAALSRFCETWARFCLALSPQERTGLAALSIFTVLVLLQMVRSSGRIETVQEFNVNVNSGMRKLQRQQHQQHQQQQQPGLASPDLSAATLEPLSNAYSLLLVGDTAREGGSRVAGDKDEWRSTLLRGSLTRAPSGDWAVRWEDPQPLRGGFSHQGRGMELSALQVWRPSDQIFTCDDRTGIVFELRVATLQLYPRWILAGGDGNTERPFKCEWMATKDGLLYIGSVGKEWVEGGREVHNDFQWVKVVTGNKEGSARSVLWEPVYDHIRRTLNAEPPGYVVHEAVQWSTAHQRWFFLPLRVSTVRWDDRDQYQRSSQVLVSCDTSFEHCESVAVGHASEGHRLAPGRGFVEFKFVPNTGDTVIAAVRVDDADSKSYLTVFTVRGKVLMPDVLIPGDQKYEGLEIMSRG
eukprot:TRINITY_DN2551_c0_g1_i1.p1 TRINITY_DN2551_c0_g1~~TRINITY_DN2551_c0_g1_i1.p1  ORF type:complete len:474 (+),score=136.89 TRINITY_DN2551_c0_g1_i1:67-1488(+)